MKVRKICLMLLSLCLLTGGMAHAQEAECKHDFKYRNEVTETPIYADETRHIVIWNGTEGSYCKNCGEASWENVYQDKLIEGEHDFWSDVCDYCGYERTPISPDECKHENVGCEDLTERETISRNEKTHIQIWNGFKGYTCQDCYYSWIVEYHDEQVEEEHIFPNGEMKCYFCDYVKAPTEQPTAEPTSMPTEAPTVVPTEVPTHAPEEKPTAEPTEAPTAAPTELPEEPTTAPTVKPTRKPVADGGHDDVPKTGDASVITGLYVLLAMTLASAYLFVKRSKSK